MTLEYNIYLVDNHHEYAKSLVPRIEGYLENLGLQPKITYKKRGDIPNDFKDKKFQLVLIDYKLDEGDPQGDELIKSINDIQCVSPIIFYSSKKGFENEIKERLQGAYLIKRDLLFDLITKFINSSLIQYQNISNMRGLVISESIILEQKMDDLIKMYFGLSSEKEKAIEKILDPKFEALSFKKKFDLINTILTSKINSLTEQMKKKSKLKTGLTKKKHDIELIKKDFQKLDGEIIQIRNIMAHAKLSEENNNSLVSINDDKPVCINNEFCINIIKSIKKHTDNMDEIIKLLA